MLVHIHLKVYIRQAKRKPRTWNPGREYILKRQAKHTRRRAKRVSQPARFKSNRGRRSKAHELEILETHGAKLAEIFKSDPLRETVDPHFAPYYQQLLEGNAHAILRYCDEFWEQGNLAGSFYELVGRLFTLKFYQIADTILRDIERRRVTGWPSERKSYEHWYRKLKSLCDRARDSMRTTLTANAVSTREQLWEKYVSQPVWQIRTARDTEHCKIRQESIRKELLEGPGSATQRATKQLSESGRLITLVNAFGSYDLLPREIFDSLALTRMDSGRRKFRLTPSDVARKYACQITDLSESTVSHWKT
jgi:hypothetical protein